MIKYYLNKVLSSFKFILLFQLLSVFIFSRNKFGLMSLLDYFFVSVFLLIRVIVCFEVIFMLLFVFLYFILELLRFKRIELGFSNKYIDSSRISLTIYTIFWKIPLAAAMFICYIILRKALNKNEKVKLDLKTIFINIIFVNIFGSPIWVFEKSFNISNRFRKLYDLDLSRKKKPWRIKFNLCFVCINDFLYTECSYYIDKCRESRIYFEDGFLKFNMFNYVFKKSGKEYYSKSALTFLQKGALKHPIIPSDGDCKEYEAGYIISHAPFNDQKHVKFTLDPSKRESCMVFNNYQSIKCIDQQGFKNIDKNKEEIELVKAAAEANRFLNEEPIFAQYSEKKELLNNKKIGIIGKNYANLKKEDALSMGMSTNAYKEIEKKQNEWTFESEHEKDLIVNALIKLTMDEINDKKDLGINLKNRFKIKNFENLTSKEKIIEEYKIRLLINEWCINYKDFIDREDFEEEKEKSDNI